MNWFGVAIGATSFLMIGIFHPVVIKCEYYFTYKIWPLFLVGGLACCIGALLVSNAFFSSMLGVLGFTMLWSIGELKHQAARVEKGWFPGNPKRSLPHSAKEPPQ